MVSLTLAKRLIAFSNFSQRDKDQRATVFNGGSPALKKVNKVYPNGILWKPCVLSHSLTPNRDIIQKLQVRNMVNSK